ncbi:universal stress protein A-like protein isoform X1 [Cajanus cajan]|uniref:universal stress protein A-like protein isoform X1 n=1 Tax=Cajanus cajan TaxID=3821 RepID=UPI00098D9143|nr:universal stress protein A-like protein isoform X1 [Cajanus cajan]
MDESGGGYQVRAGAGERRMGMKVMVAVDESDGSFYALKWALDNLLTTMATVGDATPDNEGMMFLVHVEPKVHNYVYPVGPGGAAFYPTTVVVDSVKKAQEERSTTILSRALKMCHDKLVKAESMILSGDPREMICEAAEQMQVSLLVMGSRGLGVLKRTILGSVSDYCAHHARVPILIVKPPQPEHNKKH